MATEIEIDTIINTDRSEQSLRELQKSLKQLVSLQGQVGEGSKNFKQLQNAINDTEGKIGDLTDSFQTLKGSGVERLNSSLGLLKEGFLSADPGKLKTAFSGLSAAMSAIPIFLLIEGLNFLVQNFEEVIKVVKSAIGVVDEQSLAQKRLNRELQETALNIKDLGIEYKYYEQNRIRGLDLEIEKLKQLGSTQEEIDLAVIKSEEQKLIKLKEARDKANELGIQELTKYNDAVFAQQDKIDLLYAKSETQRVDNRIKVNEKLKAENEKRAKEEEERLTNEFNQAFQLALNNQAVEQQRQIDAINAERQLNLDRAAINKQIDDDIKNNRLKNDQEAVASNIAKWDAEEKAAVKAAEQRKKDEAATIAGAQNITSNLIALNEVYFSIKSQKTQKGSKEEEALAKKQFNIGKGLMIAQAVISGIQGVQAAFTSGSAIPVIGAVTGPAFAVAAGLVAAANIVKIKNTKFNPSGSGSETSTPTVSAVPNVPTNIPTQQSQVPDPSSFNPSGLANAQTGKRREEQRVYVVESDIRNVTNRVNVIESRATF